MHCPFCGHAETKVIDSRLADEGRQVRRRRECLGCSERFTTYEAPELHLPRLVKRDGGRESFDERKLRHGLMLALEKRPVETDLVEASINRIKRRLLASGEGEVPTARLGEWVMEELRKLDHVAYIRFASVYLKFEDIEAFRDAIERLQQEPTPEEHRGQIPLLHGDHD
ncbi:MAG: transcriptional regulator NrdR [Thiotrichales bacterium]